MREALVKLHNRALLIIARCEGGAPTTPESWLHHDVEQAERKVYAWLGDIPADERSDLKLYALAWRAACDQLVKFLLDDIPSSVCPYSCSARFSEAVVHELDGNEFHSYLDRDRISYEWIDHLCRQLNRPAAVESDLPVFDGLMRKLMTS